MKRRLTTLLACLFLLLVCSHTSAAVPGNAAARGQSLDQWMLQYWTWFFGGSQANEQNNVLFLPLPVGTPSPEDPSITVGHADVTLRTGEGFFLPVFVFFGETYLDPTVPDDDPSFPPADVFTGAHVLVTLDGKTILDSERGDDLSKVYSDTQFFDHPLLYPEPSSYGSIGAIWVKGLGVVQQPLSKGNHKLELLVVSDFFGIGFHNTWNLTVTGK
jgi:hypothetical protein